ncbi:E3 ubiquitin-protein ligase CBL-B [Drosophila obscura]|uniref:E3 ubiquitin-protein ligase CBL-B n=1 Tax=Drosophila obscura TaxID=7282 RepID=UPI001BB0DD95|nr:E3 ubiquitin-protein ligase CBL-B [Drosophila obscura]
MALIFDEQGVNRGYSSDDSDGDESTHGYYTCVVCMCTAVCPRVSFCGHLFCSRCIEAWMQAQGPIVKCPYCKSRIAEKTLITVQPFSNYRQRGAAPYRRCKSLQEHRQKMLQDNEYIETPVNLPQASMFLHGEIELPPGLLPRSKPLAPQLLRQVKEQPPVQRTFVDYSWHQRGITLFIMVFLFALLNSTRDLK